MLTNFLCFFLLQNNMNQSDGDSITGWLINITPYTQHEYHTVNYKYTTHCMYTNYNGKCEDIL